MYYKDIMIYFRNPNEETPLCWCPKPDEDTNMYVIEINRLNQA